jgi:hypothetical protein
MTVNIAFQLQTLIIAGFLMIFYNNLTRQNYYYVYNKLIALVNFYNYICENNPLLLDYTDEAEIVLEKELKNIVPVPLEKYEDKYLQRFKQFPNEYFFNETELADEIELRNKVKTDFEKIKTNKLNELQETLLKINNITNGVTISAEDGSMVFNDQVKTDLLTFYNIINDDTFYNINNDELDEEAFNHLYLELLTKENELKTEQHNLKQTEITDEEVFDKARELIIKTKLDKYINNYVLEHTPLGNIYMRYNVDKGSFEYYSNNTIPYRYLEPVCRKYVMTYWCKPLFIDVEDELKKAEIKYDTKKAINEETKKSSTAKDYMVKFKSYNKETKEMMMNPRKNVLPSHIKANLVNVTQKSDKLLVKENANRYTWEGRLTNFSPLKKIDKKVADKNLSLTYADFKKMTQNKK